MKNILALQNLDIRFGATQVVKQLDLTVAPGETVALVGESGCGKSSTALAIMGLLPGTADVQGEILLGGQNLLALKGAPLRALRGSRISMIFQEPMTSLNPVMTIGRQITEVLDQHLNLSKAAAQERAIALLDLVRLPDPRARFGDFPHQLSGGQRQRVMIAMAVACEPELLIADEPTTALDVTIQAQILTLLDSLRAQMNMSLLLITHDLGVVGQYADKVAVMYGGEKLEEGPVERIFQAPSHAYTQGLLGASLTLESAAHYQDGRLAEVRVQRDPSTEALSFSLSRKKDHTREAGARQDRAQLITADDQSLAAGPNANGKRSGPILRVTDLSTHYARQKATIKAVDGVSLEIGRGETLGLVGESGCGKSSLSRTLLRLVASSAGKIELDGTDITHVNGKALRAARRKAQMIFQDPFASLNPRHTVGAMLDTALRVHDIDDSGERHDRIREVLRRVDLPEDALRRYAHEFSGGQRQRIGIARALVLRPALVICDEPVSALDVSVRAQVLNLLVELKQDLGLSYLFISHDLAVVRYIADRVLIMHGGKIVEEGDHQRIWTDPQHEYTRALINSVPRPTFETHGGTGKPTASPLAPERSATVSGTHLEAAVAFEPASGVEDKREASFAD